MNTTFAQFIDQHVDAVVDDFEVFARRSGPAAEHLASEGLRDHAKVMLQAVAADMATVQTAASQQVKAEGNAANATYSRVMATARQHAQHRFSQGFTLPQMLSEYRALRASVIRRWTAQLDVADAGLLAELTRFGEAIDEGLTEAIAWYSKRLEESRNLLIGVLAHDLRSPLGAVRMSADYLLRTDRLHDNDLRAASRIVSSSSRMARYISDLLDFSQTLLGASLPITRAPIDLVPLCADVVDELRSAHPAATIEAELPDRMAGSWDAARLSQLVSNLIANAVIHGEAGWPVLVRLSAAGTSASIEVHNRGEPIAPGSLPTLFQPLMHSRPEPQRMRGSSGLGLGLYIAREIALAHGGTLVVRSETEAGTTFTACLPAA